MDETGIFPGERSRSGYAYNGEVVKQMGFESGSAHSHCGSKKLDNMSPRWTAAIVVSAEGRTGPVFVIGTSENPASSSSHLKWPKDLKAAADFYMPKEDQREPTQKKKGGTVAEEQAKASQSEPSGNLSQSASHVIVHEQDLSSGHCRRAWKQKYKQKMDVLRYKRMKAYSRKLPEWEKKEEAQQLLDQLSATAGDMFCTFSLHDEKRQEWSGNIRYRHQVSECTQVCMC
jgi:hypothetical protein